MIEQRGTAKAAFDAIDGTIDSTTITGVFSYRQSYSRGKTAKEQRHIDYNFICLQERNLKALNNGFVLAWWVSRYIGTDINAALNSSHVRPSLLPVTLLLVA